MAYKVMIIDDNVTTVDALCKTISWKKLGLQVSGYAYDGKKGLEMMKDDQPDIMITDIFSAKSAARASCAIG